MKMTISDVFDKIREIDGAVSCVDTLAMSIREEHLADQLDNVSGLLKEYRDKIMSSKVDL